MAEIKKEALYIKLKDACARYGVGRDTMKKLAAECGALVTKCERIVLIDYKKMDEYMRN